MAPAASRRPHRSIHSHCRLCGPVFSLPLLIFFPFPSPFPLPWQPATSHTLHLFSRPTLISVFVFLRSLRSSPPFLLLLFLFFRFDRFSVGLFFNLRRNAFHGTLEESEEDFRKMKQVDFERCLTQINGVWSCHVLSYALYSMGRSFRDAGHISDCDRNSFMGTWLMTYGGAIRTCITG